jgi:hypothetical protein
MFYILRMKTPLNDFFQHFLECNGFKYNYKLDALQNFENLVCHLKLSSQGKAKLQKRFEQNFIHYKIENKTNVTQKEENQPNNFFKHFMRNNGFIFDNNLNKYENFENLILHLKCERGRSKLLEKFNTECDYKYVEEKFKNKQNLVENKIEIKTNEFPNEENQPNNFFKNFIINNGFKYDHNLNKFDNFENLIVHLKCESGRSKLLERFNRESVNNYVEEKFVCGTGYKKDLEAVEGLKSAEEYFKYFIDNYNFELEDISINYLSAFDELANFNGWWDILSMQRRKFYKLKDDEKKNFIDQNFNFHKIQDTPDLNIYDKFDQLSKILEWEDYYSLSKKKFFQVIRAQVENLFEKLEDLKYIIKRYNLLPIIEIPDNYGKCRKIVRFYLYVNIFDFINPNNDRKFEDLESLRQYTIDNRLIFPVEKAKKNFCYKVLLKKFYFNRNK